MKNSDPFKVERPITVDDFVFPAWMARLPFQQQSVMLLAARGPDGIRKHHPCKHIVRAYRATVMKAAKYGRELREGDKGDSFMSLDPFRDPTNKTYLHLDMPEINWDYACKEYFDTIDSLPHHYHNHLMHGAQIIGFNHPNEFIRGRWHDFYLKCVDDAHLNPETEEQMNKRLSDWNREFWSEYD